MGGLRVVGGRLNCCDQTLESSSTLRSRKQVHVLEPVQYTYVIDLDGRDSAIGQSHGDQVDAARSVFAICGDGIQCLGKDARPCACGGLLGQAEQDRIAVSHRLTNRPLPILAWQDILILPHRLAGSQ
jgi:hypothetical protein